MILVWMITSKRTYLFQVLVFLRQFGDILRCAQALLSILGDALGAMMNEKGRNYLSDLANALVEFLGKWVELGAQVGEAIERVVEERVGIHAVRVFVLRLLRLSIHDSDVIGWFCHLVLSKGKGE